ncbi:DUF995 domain-containing protein [Ensifer sp. 22564]|uniref:DUF995 domain-containing protein n=1 Tax=Ensifer sp. 22564 TaxID=3453943 RepID=UPI003F84EB3E
MKYKDNGNVYFTWMADGTLLGIYDKKDGTHIWADGTWTVKDNTFCFESHWKNASGTTVFTYAPCKAWFKAGKAI